MRVMSKSKNLTTRAKPKTKSKPATPPAFTKPALPQPTAVPPSRAHASAYHYPLLIEDGVVGKELLRWFEGIEEVRNMPWRKKWLDPAECEGGEEFGSLLERRAYEVWVSEVMLQQTRVSTVIPYFNTWISKWPTVDALAEASHDDVLSVWKGLGYYSRATRLHDGAKVVVSAKDGPCKIPSGVDALQKIPGIGRYTAGAVSSIAFGEAEPVLDGNVARVLSRQLGLYVDAKDKKSTDVLWEVADVLVKSVAGYPDEGRSSIPGQWNQALMELGSTICTPRPKCDECPIRRTCRVYAEGETLSLKKAAVTTVVPDIEDACTLCLQLDTEDLATAPEDAGDDEDDAPPKPVKRRKVETKPANTISNYFSSRMTPKPKPEPATPASSDASLQPTTDPSTKRKIPTPTPAQTKAIATYCSLFPKKMPKKAVPEEDAVVCVISAPATRSLDKRRWLIEQRPAKGLLASLWQFPQQTLPPAIKHTAASRKATARAYVESLGLGSLDGRDARELGSLVHVFTHLKLTMYVVHIGLETDGEILEGAPARKWVATEDMGGETLSTGMRRCWELVAAT
ncbi:DNA glycosylase [Karstenula rhodostoma CBS 690.94]|uniref:Adenine DNA glycosylase n=1 Tax=Karstenula rhodostoma CBS 690.94 TaxID=1392251 RepID=A0A9P4PVR9_9PLEO|nr:DNA glycosylase [Karstenula rhodostoma CBS 690.94]